MSEEVGLCSFCGYRHGPGLTCLGARTFDAAVERGSGNLPNGRWLQREVTLTHNDGGPVIGFVFEFEFGERNAG